MTSRELERIRMSKQFAGWLKDRVDEMLLTKPEFTGKIGIYFSLENGKVLDENDYVQVECAKHIKETAPHDGSHPTTH